MWAAVGTSAWRGLWEGGTVLSPDPAGAYWALAFLSFPVHLLCVVLSVCALFYNRNFYFNESTWGSYYLQSFQNLAWVVRGGRLKICLCFLTERKVINPAGNSPVELSGSLVGTVSLVVELFLGPGY